jgi:hypothetical protein
MARGRRQPSGKSIMNGARSQAVVEPAAAIKDEPGAPVERQAVRHPGRLRRTQARYDKLDPHLGVLYARKPTSSCSPLLGKGTEGGDSPRHANALSCLRVRVVQRRVARPLLHAPFFPVLSFGTPCRARCNVGSRGLCPFPLCRPRPRLSRGGVDGIRTIWLHGWPWTPVLCRKRLGSRHRHIVGAGVEADVERLVQLLDDFAESAVATAEPAWCTCPDERSVGTQRMWSHSRENRARVQRIVRAVSTGWERTSSHAPRSSPVVVGTGDLSRMMFLYEHSMVVTSSRQQGQCQAPLACSVASSLC